jgi:hypothetical protein
MSRLKLTKYLDITPDSPILKMSILLYLSTKNTPYEEDSCEGEVTSQVPFPVTIGPIMFYHTSPTSMSARPRALIQEKQTPKISNILNIYPSPGIFERTDSKYLSYTLPGLLDKTDFKCFSSL